MIKGDLVAAIFLIIAVPYLTLFQLWTCMNYVFQKSMEQQNFREAENHSIFSKILYLYPWKYIKRHRVIFAWIQSMYFISIGSIAALGKVIISEYINVKSFIQVLDSNRIAYAMLPMMICMLVTPIVYCVLRRTWGEEREIPDIARIEKLQQQYLHQQKLLKQETVSKRKAQRIVEDMTATLVYILSQPKEKLEGREKNIVFAVNGLNELEAIIEKKALTKDLNWQTFTMYSYPFVYQYQRAREKYLLKSANDRNYEFDRLEMTISLFFDQIMKSYQSFESIAYDPSEYLKKPIDAFLHVLNDFQQCCYEQDIENTDEIINYYHEMLKKIC